MIIIVANITCYDRIKTVRVQECLSETLGKYKKHSSKKVEHGIGAISKAFDAIFLAMHI